MPADGCSSEASLQLEISVLNRPIFQPTCRIPANILNKEDTAPLQRTRTLENLSVSDLVQSTELAIAGFSANVKSFID